MCNLSQGIYEEGMTEVILSNKSKIKDTKLRLKIEEHENEILKHKTEILRHKTEILIHKTEIEIHKTKILEEFAFNIFKHLINKGYSIDELLDLFGYDNELLKKFISMK